MASSIMETPNNENDATHEEEAEEEEEGRDKEETRKPSKKKRRRERRPYGVTTKEVYSGWSFDKRQSTGHPRSPHRFFESSHTVKIDISPNKEETKTDKEHGENNLSCQQVVHHHANGLCIVTAGENILSEQQRKSKIESIQFVVEEAPACSNAEKRKRAAKMLKGGNVAHTVKPSDVIAEIKLENGGIIPLYACVFGTITELNQSLTPEVLLDDPLMDGYLAVILPSGKFPPESNTMGTTATAASSNYGTRGNRKFDT